MKIANKFTMETISTFKKHINIKGYIDSLFFNSERNHIYLFTFDSTCFIITCEKNFKL